MIDNPILRQAKATFDSKAPERTAERAKMYRISPPSLRHSELLLAYYKAHIGESLYYFLVRYCPDCLRAVAVALAEDLPEDLPYVKDLGLELYSFLDWRTLCPVKVEVDNHD
jgi:hypothetical protein